MFQNYVKHFLKSALINSFKAPTRHFTPRRALLYVPGDSVKKMEKAMSLDVDCVVLDCEDGVSLNKKAEARQEIKKVLDQDKVKKKRRFDCAVRVNSLSSEMCKEDLKVILSAKHLPDTIILPKADTALDVQLFSDLLDEFITTNYKVGVLLMIESAMGVVNSVNICKKFQELAGVSKMRPEGLIFGSDDFCASIGAVRSEKNIEIAYARQKLVTVAKAFHLQIIDSVHIDFKDLKGFKKQAKGGAQLGFTGKQIIHPDQVNIAQQVFMPSKQRMEWASGVIKAFHEHQKKGEGVFTYKDQMIDMPTVKQAQNVVDLMNSLMITSPNVKAPE